MRLAKFKNRDGADGVGVISGEYIQPLDANAAGSLSEVFEQDQPAAFVEEATSGATAIPLADVQLLAPIDHQEVWAAGVTYKRSQAARMEESTAAASCYDRVYESPRPEIFFKATPHRVVGPDQGVRIRKDSTWNVPEPEITLVLNSKLKIVGFTVGNDMSSRDIEGENPLYLPQAKLYDQCCALGPCVTLAQAMPAVEAIKVELSVQRGNDVVYEGTTAANQMARNFEELVEWLGRDNTFPHGAFLLTGTGIVPDSGFTLQADDRVEIRISGIGTLSNPVICG